ncbi:serine hydrolase domain-containing protein [Amycolatopsis nalaikhensis]|uniref:Serine hydrolase domain-containing protein n=1 Tax=Amycolatopsis nalaikhensis TaxID=715472 RepID=A0ABY8XHE8_9PSEU|nr:serine hydrolase domain-containing protein [Amycolatopsis sp. 2-2]WIV55041.1 serine hydrolase domain-containing protein [Amycolatopsis sp. 2-2]
MAPGFEPVREAFSAVLARTSGGAAFSVVRRGEVLVELWGGPGWTRDTLVVLFSGTKGVVATLMALLTAQGRIDPSSPVKAYWPEFSSGDARVSHVLSHTVGLPYVAADVSFLDNRANALALASQRPLWTPGTRVAYHAATFGYLCTELIRRVTGRSVGAVLRSLLGDVDIHLGTPPSEDHRVARLTRSPDYRISTFLHDPRRRRIVEKMYRGLLDADTINAASYRRAELAAGGATGTAAAMARLYDRIRAGLIPAPVLAEATRTWSSGTDAINDRPVHFGLGYELPDPLGTYGPVGVAFGHSGAGGGRHGAWPEAELGFSFTTGELQSEDVDDRGTQLLTALAGCL